MAHEGYHEPVDKLSPETMDFHRAVVSLIEELEAVDWYNQRVDACGDPELRGILAHNRDEEIEHASMTLEWIRRHSPVFDKELREALFKTGPITDHR
jgi:ferritin-like protein